MDTDTKRGRLDFPPAPEGEPVLTHTNANSSALIRVPALLRCLSNCIVSAERVKLKGGAWLQLGLLLFVVSVMDPVRGYAQKLGDVNRDGVVDIGDAVLILNHVQGIAVLTTNQLALPLADADTNGTINFADFQRVVDIILGRHPIQEFDLALLDYDDGDGLTFLEEFAAGTNPYLLDTYGNGLNDEVNLHSAGMVIMAQPPLELLRTSLAEGSSAVLLAQPLLLPPNVVRYTSTGGSASSVVLAAPPVEVLRAGLEGTAGALVAQPPVEVIRSDPTGGGALLAQPPLTVTRE